MIKRFASHLSVANVIAVIALVAAIGTGAAFGLPGKSTVDKNDIAKNAVKSKQVKNNGIKGADIADGAVTGAEVADGSIGGAEVDEGSLGTVPTAGDAATVGGLRPEAFERAGTVRTFQVRVPIESPSTEVFAAGPFRLFGTCGLSPGGQLQPQVNVMTTENDSIASATQFTSGDAILENGDGDFDVGESLMFASYQESSPASVLTTATGRMASPSGVSVTVDLTVASRVFSNNPSERVGCLYAGSAIVNPP